MYKITKIHEDSLIMILLIVNLVYATMQYLVALATGKETLSIIGMEFELGAIDLTAKLFEPLGILFAVILESFVLGIVSALLVNLLLRWTGGFKFEMKKHD